MQFRFRQAREERGLSAVDLAARLQVHPSTITNWEAGRRQITSEKLLQMSEILDFSVDYLLGKECLTISQIEKIPKEALPSLHGQPVWSASRGWMLVNIVKAAFVLHDCNLLDMKEMDDSIYLLPPSLSVSLRGIGSPLCLETVITSDKVWVEPITSDMDLAAELRGWYHPHKRKLVQNDFGQQFFMDTYGVKWLAFNSLLSDLENT